MGTNRYIWTITKRFKIYSLFKLTENIMHQAKKQVFKIFQEIVQNRPQSQITMWLI